MRFYHTIKFIIAISVSFGLTGCISLKAPSLDQQQTQYHTSSAQARAKRLQAVKRWNIHGALSVQQPQQNFIAAYQWQQRQQHFTISLHSQMNLASIILKGTPDSITLIDNKGHRSHASNFRDLMQQQMGWSLPVSQLRFWILSLKAPGKAALKTNSLGQTTEIDQFGWRIRYTRYQRINQLELPTLINLAGHKMNIRIVIKQWRL